MRPLGGTRNCDKNILYFKGFFFLQLKQKKVFPGPYDASGETQIKRFGVPPNLPFTDVGKDTASYL